MDIDNLKPAGIDVKVLGTGCAKCSTLEKQTKQAIDELGISATVTKVEDIMEIMKFNVMTTPALVVDGKVMVKGKVPSLKELKEILSK
ncbi:thioredoxin family protein [Carboxylicivirga sp. N1Y90]|uniref:thioredoxin family protein n=1 Tax=Carboxylicivirga fragile TaxID=3417571 RepID=UPI003D353436